MHSKSTYLTFIQCANSNALDDGHDNYGYYLAIDASIELLCDCAIYYVTKTSKTSQNHFNDV